MLEEERKRIDSLDEEIKKLLRERLELSRTIGAYKYANGIAVCDPKREEEILCRLCGGETETAAEYIKEVYSSILSASKKAQTPRYGLLTGHSKGSLSPFIHSCLGNDDYLVYQMPSDGLERFARSGILGFNVTMPYKVDVMRFLDVISDEAKEVGSVNTVKNVNGVLYGCNTDVFGLSDALDRAGMAIEGKKVCILGTGGTSKAAQYVCRMKNAPYVVVSRTDGVTYADKEKYRDADFLINCTPVGMGKGCADTPIDLDVFESLEGVFDVIYTPYVTKLVYCARKKGINAENGLYMLLSQAVKTHEFFFDVKVGKEKTEEIYSRLLSLRPAALVGMPGCGKTTLASLSGVPYADTDELIEKKTGRKCADIINEDGEKAFRSLETEVIRILSASPPDVVSLGGGALTDEESEFLVRSNFRTVWIKRGKEKLVREGRPLSVRIDELYEKRRRFYEISDYTLENDGSPAEGAEKLREIITEGKK